jgi:DNA-3-methyladenine glycosylase I
VSAQPVDDAATDVATATLPSTASSPGAELGDVPTAPGSGVVVGPDGLSRPAWAATDPLMREYYDTEWGVPVEGERAVFERLSLEAFQAGLSWATILRKRPAFRELFHDFDADAVAAMTDDDVERLMGEPRIIRNRAKILATRTNARATVALREDSGLEALVWSYRPETTPLPRTIEEVPSRTPASVALSKELRRRGFAFVGPTTMHALMEAIGIVDTHLLGSHRRGVSGLWKPDGTRA